MIQNKFNILAIVFLLTFVSLGCQFLKRSGSSATHADVVVNTVAPNANKTSVGNRRNGNSADETASTSGAEKMSPAAGKGNVQGKVLFNDKPAAGIEVKLCEKFSTILGVRCEGKTLTAKTDAEGIYVIANASPMTYQGLTARVFTSDYYIFPQQGIMTPQQFNVEADKTIFARDINLFKNDLKLANPKSGSKTDAKTLEIKWESYADAAYYKVYMHSEDYKGTSPYVGERVDDTTFAVDGPLANGKYRLKIEAFNTNDRKLAESSSDIKFTVTGGVDTLPTS